MKTTGRKLFKTSSTVKKGVLVELSRRESSALSGSNCSVKAYAYAFTLIELLVVITIIAILAALLLPVLNRAKQAGWKASCLSNFKQLQYCYHMYVDDNSDNLPLNNIGSGAGITSWIAYVTPGASAQYDYNTVNIRKATIYQYNQNPKIYVCPANTYTLIVGANNAPPGPYRDDWGKLISANTLPQTRTCSIEYSLGSGGGSTPPWTLTYSGITWKTYQKYSQIQAGRVASKIVFVDESSGTVDDGAFAMWPMNSGINAWWNLPTSRHDNGGIFSFADGHVEYYKWHGGAVSSAIWQTSGPGNNGPGFSSTQITADSSDDLSRVQAGGPQYP